MNKILLILSIILLNGCSFVFKDTRVGSYYKECNPSVAPPAVDTVMTVLSAGVAISTQTDIYDNHITKQEREIIATSTTIGAIVYGIAAIHGYVNSGTCE